MAVNRVQKVLEDANIKLPSVVSSIQGVSTHVRPHHRFMLAELLTHMDGLNQQLAHLNERIKQQATPHEALIKRLDEIPGVGRHTAAILLAEIGCNVDPFPSEKHLTSWACLCPGHNISANKRRTGARKGQKWLRAALAEAACWAASRTQETYLGDQFHRLRVRRGPEWAAGCPFHLNHRLPIS